MLIITPRPTQSLRCTSDRLPFEGTRALDTASVNAKSEPPFNANVVFRDSAIVSGEVLEHVVKQIHDFVRDAIDDPCAALFSLDHADGAEELKLGRYAGLGDLEGIDELTDAEFAL
jgi:hypothetical protein